MPRIASRPIMLAVTFTIVAFAIPVSGAEGESSAGGKVYPCRWYFNFGKDFYDDASLETIKKRADTAAAHGLNGVVVGVESLLLWDAARVERLKRFKEYCDERKLEVIPLGFSVGYGSGVATRNPNLCEGLLVKDVLFQVTGRQANVVSDSPVPPSCGGFENLSGDSAKGFDGQDGPGKCTFIDTQTAKEGSASLRMELDKSHQIRLIKKLPTPHKHYVMRFWAKASALTPSSFAVCIYDGDQQVSRLNFRPKEDWQKYEISVHTQNDAQTVVYLGVWSGKSGKLWIDGMEIFEPGMVNLLRRDGTPVIVKRDGSEESFQEGVDYEKIVDAQMLPRQAWHTPPAINVMPGGKIKDGDKLRVSYYTTFASSLEKHQTVLCMSEPKVYDVWRETAARINEILHPATWMLDMDEIRGGGTCETCRNRKNDDGSPMTSAQILGNCINRQVALIRKINPQAKVAIWNDMLDPNGGAVPKYFYVNGGFAESWKYVPRDLIIVPWVLGTADQSIAHFAKLGHPVIAAGYYDADDLDGCKTWLQALSKTDKALGIMYTTWEEKYDLLSQFGDLVNLKQ